MPFDYKFFLEVFGYVGTVLVIISMLMTSVVKLRILNAFGSLISMIYAVLGKAWPIVVLNGSLIVINVAQLVRMTRAKVLFNRVTTTAGERSVEYFLSLYEGDIQKYFPDVRIDERAEAHVAYIESEAVGLIIGERRGEELDIQIDYSSPKYRDLSVSTYLFSKLWEDGVRKLNADVGVPERQKYLLRMGFLREGERMVKMLAPKE